MATRFDWAMRVPWLRSFPSAVLDAVLPQTCAACAAWIPCEQGVVCPTCRVAATAYLAAPACAHCGRTVPPAAIHSDGCARCRTEYFWNLAGVVRVGPYTPVLRSMLTGLKYRGDERPVSFLVDLLATALKNAPWGTEIDTLVPVPMHWLRRSQRPCDHAAVLTVELGRRIGVRVVRLVRRAKHGPSQTAQPTKSARFENVRGCFGPAPWYLPPWPKPDVSGRVVCIIDNLLVTGATVVEVSKVLRRAGARRIYAAVVARPAAPGDPRSSTAPSTA
ncbi:MAG: ComF family protein [Phycisphaerales bacterium]|nr:ComF family protein [Phycisphaerales bacterium]